MITVLLPPSSVAVEGLWLVTSDSSYAFKWDTATLSTLPTFPALNVSRDKVNPLTTLLRTRSTQKG